MGPIFTGPLNGFFTATDNCFRPRAPWRLKAGDLHGLGLFLALVLGLQASLSAGPVGRTSIGYPTGSQGASTAAQSAGILDPFFEAALNRSAPAAATRAQTGKDGLAARLQGLGSANTQERAESRSWLQGNLKREDARWVAEFVLEGDVGSRWALADLLASHNRHFALAVRLATHEQESVQEVGLVSLEQAALRWNPMLADAPLKAKELPEEWNVELGRELVLEVDPKDLQPGGLPLALERLQRSGELPIDLVLDPDLSPARNRAKPPLRQVQPFAFGTWSQILRQLVRAHRASFEVWAWRPKGVEGELSDSERVGSQGMSGGRPFIRVRRAGRLEKLPGPRLLAHWMQRAARETDPKDSAACAFALAQLGWPDAVAWFSEACILGRAEFWPALCISADRGRIPMGLMREDGIRGLLQSATEPRAQVNANSPAPRRDWSRLDLAARALKRIPVVVEGSTPLAEMLLPGEGDSAQRIWLCLAGYTGRDRPDSKMAALATEVLLGSEWLANVSLRRSALGAMAAASVLSPGSGPVRELKGALVLLEGLSPKAFERTVVQAERLRLSPQDTEGLEAAFEGRLARMALWLHTCGDSELAIQWLRRSCQTTDGFQETVSVLASAFAVGRGEQVGQMLQSLGATSEDARIADRLALGLGIIERVRGYQMLDALLAVGVLERTREDWLDLGYFSTNTATGARARGALIGALGQGVSAEFLGPALHLAITRIRAQRDPVRLEEFEGDLRRVAVRSSHPLTGLILEGFPAEMDGPGSSEQGFPKGQGLTEPLGAGDLRPPN